jgi:hypothetical protein
MRSRLAARLVTGPFSFLLAGVIDVLLLWGAWGAQAAWTRLRRRASG